MNKLDHDVIEFVIKKQIKESLVTLFRLLTKWYFRKQISKIPFFINVKSIYTTKKSKKQHIPMLSLLSI